MTHNNALLRPLQAELRSQTEPILHLSEPTPLRKAQGSDGAGGVVDLRWFRNARGEERIDAAQSFFASAREYGFLYLTGHGVSDATLDAVYEQAERFFAQPLPVKLRYEIARQPNHRGYVGVHERGDYADEGGERRYEAFDLGGVMPSRKHDLRNPLSGPNCWPDQSEFRWVIARYLREMRRISREVATMIALALGQPEDALWRHMINPMSQLRLLHYLPGSGLAKARDKDGHGPVGMGAHTDYECFTVLHATRSNLQVLDRSGMWRDLAPRPGAFYFNIGDLCEAWTGGLLTATPHRVIDTGEERFSLPYFCGTDYDTIVSPLPAADPAMRLAQRAYEPLHAGNHLLTQLLRDFAYLRERAQRLPLAVDRWEPSPFEARIRQAA